VSITIHSRGRLPHWELANGLYFITFRTASAVSTELISKLRLSRYTPDEIRKEVELSLDTCAHGDILRGPAAEIVANSILFGHERDYFLDTWCVMPNHVHLLLKLPVDRPLSKSLQALKSCTAHRINKLMGTTGAFWEREYFDRLARPGQANTIRRYILNNPAKANLSDGPWCGQVTAGGAPAVPSR
jgi:REP element-mobilizing transposase RayT